MSDPKAPPESPEARSARILARVEAKQLRPDLDYQLEAHRRLEAARTAALAAMREFTVDPIGRDLDDVLEEFAALLDVENEARAAFLAAVKRSRAART